MGFGQSKLKKKNKKKGKNDDIDDDIQQTRTVHPNREHNFEIVNDDIEADRKQIQNLKRQLKNDPHTFVLNHMMMSVMFFADYGEEMRELASKSSTQKERQINVDLVHSYQKECCLPDTVMERVNERVRYEHTTGPNSGLVESIVPLRMFVAHNSVSVIRKEDIIYQTMDKSTYRALAENSYNRGFVRIKLLGTWETSTRVSEDPIYSELPEDIYQTKEEAVRRRGSPSTPKINGSSDSGVHSESDYDYAKVVQSKTPKKLKIPEKDIYTPISQLPLKCKTPVDVKDVNSETDFFVTQYYLNSGEFMSHFKDVFRNDLGGVLGFDAAAIEEATYIAGVIYCNSSNVTGYDVTPAISMPFLREIASGGRGEAAEAEQALHPLIKEQENPRRWLNEEMAKEIRSRSCMVIPRGFVPKRGENPDANLEWEVVFPKAEQYLQTQMSYEQVHVFLCMAVLHKTFIEPMSEKHGLRIEHIRTLIFWECEKDRIAWPLHNLGVKLVLVLKSLCGCLGNNNLDNFFIKRKNELENVPQKYLRFAKDRFYRIVEAPALYMLGALKGLRYVSRKFYPELDFDELYNILTYREVLRNVHPAVALTSMAQAQIMTERRKKKNKEELDKEQLWHRRLHARQQQEKMMRIMEERMRSEPVLAEQKESIDYEQPLQSFENALAQAPLLKFFIRHFIAIAKKSFKLSETHVHMRFYLKQAWYLAKILEDIDPDRGRYYFKQISDEEDREGRVTVRHIPPPMPVKKPSVQFHPTTTLKLRNSEIRIDNLKRSFDANSIRNREPAKKRTPIVVEVEEVVLPSTSGFRKNAATIGEYEIKKKTTLQAKTPSAVVVEMPSTSGLKMAKTKEEIEVEEDRDGFEDTKRINNDVKKSGKAKSKSPIAVEAETPSTFGMKNAKEEIQTEEIRSCREDKNSTSSDTEKNNTSEDITPIPTESSATPELKKTKPIPVEMKIPVLPSNSGSEAQKNKQLSPIEVEVLVLPSTAPGFKKNTKVKGESEIVKKIKLKNNEDIVVDKTNNETRERRRSVQLDNGNSKEEVETSL